MNISELCQFLESNIDPIKPGNEPEIIAQKQSKTLADVEDHPIPVELQDGPRIAFVIEDIDTPLVKILQKAKKYIGSGKAPVLLSICDGCEYVGDENFEPESVSSVITDIDYENKVVTMEPVVDISEVPPEGIPEVAMEVTPEDLDNDYVEKLAGQPDLEDSFPDVKAELPSVEERIEATIEAIEAAPLLLADPTVIEDDENTEKTYE